MAVGSVQVTVVADDEGENAQERQDVIAVLAIVNAVGQVRAAEKTGAASGLAAARDALRGAVRAARSGNTSWEVIAEALGVSRDKAYNQFRRRLDSEGGKGES